MEKNKINSQMTLIDFIGWSGVICFAICGVPQLIKTIKCKDIEGLSLGSYLFWFAGGILMSINSIVDELKPHLILNYLWTTLVSGAVIVAYLVYKNQRNQ
jgi:uncharacterized protein with PQ loop repeat